MDDYKSWIKPVAHEPSIVRDCWNEPLFYLNERCLCTTFYSCRYQSKAQAVMVSGRPCYECSKHKPEPIRDIVDWINQLGFKNEDKKRVE
jgi:hypothetical protein